MLRRIFIENFRAFDSLAIDLAKVNLFFGPNNAGKSAILSSVNLLAQTLESVDPYAAVLLRGKFEDLGSYRDMVHGNDPKKRVKLGIGFDITEAGSMEASRRKRKAQGIRRYNAELAIVLEYQPKRRRIVVGSSALRIGGETILATRLVERSERQAVEEVRSRFSEISPGRLNRLVRLDHFLPRVDPPFAKRWKQEDLRTAFNLGWQVNRFNRSARELLEGVEFIGPFRSKAQRVYALSGESPSTVGVHGDKAVDILISDYLAGGKRRRDISERVSAWLQKAEIGKIIEPRILSPRHVEIQVGHFTRGSFRILPMLATDAAKYCRF